MAGVERQAHTKQDPGFPILNIHPPYMPYSTHRYSIQHTAYSIQHWSIQHWSTDIQHGRHIITTDALALQVATTKASIGR